MNKKELEKKKKRTIENGIDFYLWRGYFDISFPFIFEIKEIKDINSLLYKKIDFFKPTKSLDFLEQYNNKLRFKSIQNIFSYFYFFYFIKKEKDELILNYTYRGILENSNYNFIQRKSINSSALFTYCEYYPLFKTNIRLTKEENKEINSYRRKYRNSSEKRENIKKIKKENNFEITLDVINFFESIYTHKIFKFNSFKQITLLNSEEIMEQYNKNEKDKFVNQNSQFDKCMRTGKNNVTNGILIGPFSSTIFSEILLNQISIILADNDFFHERFCDEFKFYFQTKEKYEESFFNILKIFKTFGLSVKIKDKKNKNAMFKELDKQLNEIFQPKINWKEILFNFNEKIEKEEEIQKNMNYFNASFYNKITNKIKSSDAENIKINDFKDLLLELFKKILLTPKTAINIYIIFLFFLNLLPNEEDKHSFIYNLFEENMYLFKKIIKTKKRTSSIWWLFMQIDLFNKHDIDLDPNMLMEYFDFVNENDKENYIYFSLFLNMYLNLNETIRNNFQFSKNNVNDWIEKFLKNNWIDLNDYEQENILYSEKFIVFYTIINSNINNEIRKEVLEKYEIIEILIQNKFTFFNNNYILHLQVSQY